MTTLEILDQVKKNAEFKNLIRLGESGHHRRLGEIDAHEKLDQVISALCDVILKQDEALQEYIDKNEPSAPSDYFSADGGQIAFNAQSQVAAMLAKIVGT